MAFVESVIEPLGWTLLHFVWQALALGVLHEVALRWAGRRTPQTRYRISLLTLLGLFAAPVATFALLFEPGGEPAVRAATSAPAAIAAAVPAFQPAGPLLATINAWLPQIVLAWIAGVAVFALRFALGVAAVRRLGRGADFDAVPEWINTELERLVECMNVGRRVRVAISVRIGSPLVVGWLNPIVYLPLTAATGLDHRQLSMVLAHELAHLRRYDHLVNLLQVLAETLFFYHPVVHRVSRSLRQERELCCDDMAAAYGTPLAYAHVLAQLEEMRQRDREPALALGIAQHELYSRIHRLVSDGPAPETSDRWLPVLLVLAAGLLVAGRGLDLDAPLLPAWFEDNAARVRVSLELPPATSRPFRPIRAASGETAVVAAVAEDERAMTTSAPAVVEQKPVEQAQSTTSTAATSPPSSRDSGASEQAVAVNTADSATNPKSRTIQPDKQDASPPLEAEPVTGGGELLHATEAQYPRRALRNGTEGYVELAFTINPDGRVRDVEVTDAVPRGLFENAAVAAIQQWQYTPFTENGTAVAKRASQIVEFRLSSDPRPRNGTSAKDCVEKTGTRLCRSEQSTLTELRVVNQ